MGRQEEKAKAREARPGHSRVTTWLVHMMYWFAWLVSDVTKGGCYSGARGAKARGHGGWRGEAKDITGRGRCRQRR